MGLTITLDLGELDDRLEARPLFGQFAAVGRLAVESVNREHPSVAQVAIVRDGEHLGSCPLLELVEVLPQILGILAIVLRERHRLVGYAGVSTEDDVPVQVVAAEGRVLVADQGRETSRLVVFVGEGRVLFPGRFHHLIGLDRWVLLRERGDNLHRCLELLVVVPLQHVIPLPPFFLRQDHLITLLQLRHQTVHLGVIRQNEEVERTCELGPEAVGGCDLLTPCEPECVLLLDRAHRARIDGNGRVQVRVTSVDGRWKATSHIGGELLLHRVNDSFPGGKLLGEGGYGKREGCRKDHQSARFHGVVSLIAR